MSDYKSFPTLVLPEPLQSFIREAAAAFGVDDSLLALPTLSALASCVGNSRRISLKSTWQEPCIVWTISVAPSGSMKSPAFRAALAPLHAWQTDEIEHHRAASESFEAEKIEHESKLTEWRKSKKLATPPTKPTPPALRRFVVNDVNVEAVSCILEENPRGVLLARDELAGWLRSFDAHRGGKGGDSARWIETFHGQMLTIDRKTDRQLIHIPRASVCVTGTIQPETLRSSLGREHYENGLAARLLMAMPPRRVHYWSEAELNEKTDRRRIAMYRGLNALTGNTDRHGHLEPIDLPLDAGGKRAFVHFVNYHAEQQILLDGDLAATWSKLQGYAARFALLFHLIRQVNEDPSLENPNAIDSVSVASAIQLVQWFGDEARRIQSVMIEGETDATTRRLTEVIRAKGGRITIRELQRGSMQGQTASQIRDELITLQSKGVGVLLQLPATGENGGRPKETFILQEVAMEESELIRLMTNDKTTEPKEVAV